MQILLVFGLCFKLLLWLFLIVLVALVVGLPGHWIGTLDLLRLRWPATLLHDDRLDLVNRGLTFSGRDGTSL